MTLIVIFSPSVPKLFDPQEDSNVRRSFVIYRLQYKSMTEVPTKWPPFCRRHCQCIPLWLYHYGDVIMGTLASQITSLTIVYSTVYSDTDHRKNCVGNSPGTGEFPAQMASNAENVTIWLRHHVLYNFPWLKLLLKCQTENKSALV